MGTVSVSICGALPRFARFASNQMRYCGELMPSAICSSSVPPVRVNRSVIVVPETSRVTIPGGVPSRWIEVG